MRRARIWLLLCFGCLFGCCPEIDAAEPSGRTADGSHDARSRALVDRLMTSDPQDWCAFSSCLRPAPPEPSGGSAASNYERYADKVVATDRNHERVGVSVYGWLGINDFQQLADASARNPDFCIRFLSERKHSERQRHVAILSMYGLSIDQHMVFPRAPHPKECSVSGTWEKDRYHPALPAPSGATECPRLGSAPKPSSSINEAPWRS